MRRLLCVLGFHQLVPIVDLHPEKSTNHLAAFTKACLRCDAWYTFFPGIVGKIRVKRGN